MGEVSQHIGSGTSIDGGVHADNNRADNVEQDLGERVKIGGDVTASGNITPDAIKELIKEGEELNTSQDKGKAESWYKKVIKSIPKIADKAAKIVNLSSNGATILQKLSKLLDLLKTLF